MRTQSSLPPKPFPSARPKSVVVLGRSSLSQLRGRWSLLILPSIVPIALLIKHTTNVLHPTKRNRTTLTKNRLRQVASTGSWLGAKAFSPVRLPCIPGSGLQMMLAWSLAVSSAVIHHKCIRQNRLCINTTPMIRRPPICVISHSIHTPSIGCNEAFPMTHYFCLGQSVPAH